MERGHHTGSATSSGDRNHYALHQHLESPIYHPYVGGPTKSFSDIVMTGEMIENAVRSGKIDAGESAKRSALRKKENEINNVGA